MILTRRGLPRLTLVVGIDEVRFKKYVSTSSSPVWSSMTWKVSGCLSGPLGEKVTNLSTSVPEMSTNC